MNSRICFHSFKQNLTTVEKNLFRKNSYNGIFNTKKLYLPFFHHNGDQAWVLSMSLQSFLYSSFLCNCAIISYRLDMADWISDFCNTKDMFDSIPGQSIYHSIPI